MVKVEAQSQTEIWNVIEEWVKYLQYHFHCYPPLFFVIIYLMLGYCYQLFARKLLFLWYHHFQNPWIIYVRVCVCACACVLLRVYVRAFACVRTCLQLSLRLYFLLNSFCPIGFIISPLVTISSLVLTRRTLASIEKNTLYFCSVINPFQFHNNPLVRFYNTILFSNSFVQVC